MTRSKADRTVWRVLILVAVVGLCGAGVAGATAGAAAGTTGTGTAPAVDPGPEPEPNGTDAPPGEGVRIGGPVAVATGEPIHVNYTVDREPGSSSMRVTVRVDLPSNVDRFNVTTLPPNASVVSTQDFQRVDGNWKTTTSGARMVYEMPFRFDTSTGPGAVDEGDWAFTGELIYSVRFTYVYAGDDPGYEIHSRSASGDAVAGDFLYWGGYSVVDVSGPTTMDVVVADDTSLPDAARQSLASANANLDIGGRPDKVRMFVVPDPMRRGGRASGVRDSLRGVWVNGNSDVASPNNVWVHEYVHARQTYRRTSRTRWFTEASAEYLAAYRTAAQGRISFGQFHDSMVTENYRSAVLSRPGSWSSRNVPYDKGAHVLAALDAKIRANSDGSIEDVFRRINGQQFALSDFKDAVEAVAGKSFDSWIDRYVTTDDIPTVPDDASKFELGGGTETDLVLQANATTVETDDSIRFTVTRSDTGERVDATLSVDGRTVQTGGDGRATLSFQNAGQYTVRASKDGGTTTFNDATTTVTVESGGSGGLTADRSLSSTTAAPGGSVTATVTVDVASDVDRLAVTENVTPAAEDVALQSVTVDGQSTFPTAQGSSSSGLTVALNDVSAGSTVTVTYRVTVGNDTGTSHALSGRAVTGSESDSLGRATVTVATGGPVDRADRDGNGRISTGELSTAIGAWTNGQYTTDELNTIITAWVNDS